MFANFLPHTQKNNYCFLESRWLFPDPVVLLWRDLIGTPPRACVRISRSLSHAVISWKNHREKAPSEDLNPLLSSLITSYKAEIDSWFYSILGPCSMRSEGYSTEGFITALASPQCQDLECGNPIFFLRGAGGREKIAIPSSWEYLRGIFKNCDESRGDTLI